MSVEVIDVASSSLTLPPLELDQQILAGFASLSKNGQPGDIDRIPTPPADHLLFEYDEMVIADDAFDVMSSTTGGDDESEPIVVIGKKLPTAGNGDGTGGGGGGGGGPARVYTRDGYTYTAPGEVEETTVIDPPADDQVIEISLNIDPTASEQAVLQAFADKIAEVGQAIRNLADNETITLSDNSTVTGAELKRLWATVDFVINPIGTTYPNGSTTGESKLVNGQLQISFNIDTVTGYAAYAGGLDYLILHDVAHATGSARNLYDLLWGGDYTPEERELVERRANDIARAIAYEEGLSFFNTPEYGFSTANPYDFTVDSGGSGTPGDPGGGIEPPMPE